MAKKTVKELVTKWGFQVNDKPLREMKKQVADLKANLKTLSAVAIANGLAIFGLAENTAHAANEARLAAARTGLTTQEYQKLAFAAKVNGVEQETLAHAFMLLNRNIFAAKTNSKEAAAGFVALGGGVAQAVAKGASTATIFKMTAEQISKMKDPAKQGALAMQIFGRSGAMMLPLLKKGAAGIAELEKKAEDLGLVFDNETIRASEEFHESFEELKGSIIGFKNSVGSAIIQPVTMIIKAVSEWMRQNRELIKSQLKEFFKGLQVSLSIVLIVLKRVGEAVTGLSSIFGGLGSMLRIVITLFSVVKVLQFMSSLGQLAMMVGKLQLAWKGLTIAEIAADAAALLIPVAIGAAILFVIALIEDLIGMFQGKNSLTGLLIDTFKNKFPEATKFLSDALQTVIDKFTYLWDTAKSVFKWVSDNVPSVGGAEINSPSATAGAAAGSILGGPQSSPGGNPYAHEANSSSVSMGDINVHVAQTNATPTDIGEAVHEAVFKKGLDKILRPAGRALSPGEAY